MVLILVAVAALAVGATAVATLERVRRRRALGQRSDARRIAFPFTGLGLSQPALAAALRIARAEDAALMPVYLALVPLQLPLDMALTGECEQALPLLEAVEQRAARAGVRVDSRIERGRSVRHALAQLIAHERFEQMVVAAAAHGQRGDGFVPEDVAWLLDSAPGEVIALRANPVTRPHASSADPVRPRADGTGGTRSVPARRAASPAGWTAVGRNQ